MHVQVAAMSKLSMQARRDRRTMEATGCMAQYDSLAAVEPAQARSDYGCVAAAVIAPIYDKQYS